MTPDPPRDPPVPLAFTQGVGTVYQFAGVVLFLSGMAVCCGSAVLSKDVVTRTDLAAVGWHLPTDPPGRPTVSGTLATTLAVSGTILLGMALAGVGLGLQALHRRAPWLAAGVSGLGALFWVGQVIFAIDVLQSIALASLSGTLAALFAALAGLGVAALREMRRAPPPVDHEVLPADYRVPYSHLNQDPPEVRLARELDQRRQKLAIEQAEIERLAEKLRKRERS